MSKQESNDRGPFGDDTVKAECWAKMPLELRETRPRELLTDVLDDPIERNLARGLVNGDVPALASLAWSAVATANYYKGRSRGIIDAVRMLNGVGVLGTAPQAINLTMLTNEPDQDQTAPERGDEQSHDAP